MDYIHVKSIGGSSWTIRKDQIAMIINRKYFSEEDLKGMPELKDREACAIIHLIGESIEYFCEDSYESILNQLGIPLEKEL